MLYRPYFNLFTEIYYGKRYIDFNVRRKRINNLKTLGYLILHQGLKPCV